MHAAVTAAPNGPVSPGAWKPSFSLLCFDAAPMRNITSHPATIAVRSVAPLQPVSSPSASATGTSAAPGCTPAPGLRRLSSSKPCAKTPLASAASGALTRPGTPIMRLVPAPP